MGVQNNIKSVLEGHSLVPVVTFQQDDNPEGLINYLIRQEIQCIEITLRTAAGLKAIEYLKKIDLPNVLVGAGTVTSQEQIKNLKDIGADFIVSPGLTVKLQAHMEESGIPYLPGVATPSEIMAAQGMGLDTLKFFPANLFGGKKALKTFGNLFPNIKFCPTGGITKLTSKEYLELENEFAVGGSWFQTDYNIKMDKI